MLAHVLLGLAGAATVSVSPLRIGRLKLPVYGAEHLLVLQADDERSLLLPALLSFADGQRLERALRDGSEPRDRLAVAADLVGRSEVFAAASGRSSPWQLALLADGSRSATELTLDHLRDCGLLPLHCTVGGDGTERPGSGVRLRDMGAFTGAAPSAVQLDELAASIWVRSAAGEDGALPLSGTGEAVLLSRCCQARGEPIPMLVSEAVWQERAIDPERLPECHEESIVNG